MDYMNKIKTYFADGIKSSFIAPMVFGLVTATMLSSCGGSEKDGATTIEIDGENSTIFINVENNYIGCDVCPDGTYEKNQPSSRPSSPSERPSSPSQKEPQPESPDSSQPSGDQQQTIDDTVREEVKDGSYPREPRHEQGSSRTRSSSSYTPSQTTSSGCPDYQAPRKDVSYRTGFKPVGTSTCGGEYQRSMEERHANYQNTR